MKISIVIPVYNEEKNIQLINEELLNVFSNLSYDCEIIYVNDGSSDFSQVAINHLTVDNKKVKSLEFSRNFGKEAATSAGLQYATGSAVILIDADLQHPTALIPQLIERWERGADVVIGLRIKSKNLSLFKTFFSFLYNKMMTIISDTPIEPGSTDFRLIDRKVVNEFNKFTEHERITRGLIDWLGFKREFIKFEAEERANGVASYSYFKLIHLAVSSFIAHSLIPLKFAGYLGVSIIIISGLGGLIIFIERYLLNDIFYWNISGTAQLAVLLVFFIGIVLACLGLVALYIGNIHKEVSGRPLYVIRDTKNI